MPSAKSLFAQNTEPQTRESALLQQPTTLVNQEQTHINYGLISSIIMLLILIWVIISTRLELQKLRKSLKLDEYKNKDLKKKLRLALVTIKKMETNPDLIHSREFNLDYLRLRMEEDIFRSYIVNRLKIKITQVISKALRPERLEGNIVGIIAGGRKVDEIFEITYELQDRQGEWITRVLFRVQIKLNKLPIQSSTSTIRQILHCIEDYLSSREEDENWQPAIQGNLVNLAWDQNAKPTPLLVLEQTEEGMNYNF
jgi:hypothetical protein